MLKGLFVRNILLLHHFSSCVKIVICENAKTAAKIVEAGMYLCKCMSLDVAFICLEWWKNEER